MNLLFCISFYLKYAECILEIPWVRVQIIETIAPME